MSAPVSAKAVRPAALVASSDLAVEGVGGQDALVLVFAARLAVDEAAAAEDRGDSDETRELYR